jgi:dTDP-glucose 4,6-dehydratase
VLRKGTVGEVYNIGGFNEKQNIDIVHEVIDIVAELTDTKPRHDLVKFVKDRAGHDMRYAIAPDKIADQLGWYPVTPFSEGIRKTVAWYLANRDWTRSVTSGQYREYYERMYLNR